jgi:radical SAM protein with 4Fe4S-binding SPASM domain
LCLEYDLSDSVSLLINGLSGAVDIMSKTDLLLMRANPAEYALHNPSLVPALVRRGYLFETERQEAALRATLVERIRERLAQQEVIFMLCPTDFCPMGCSYCFAGKRPQAAGCQAISDAVIDSAFRTIQDIHRRRPGRLSMMVLYGGEPFQEFTRTALEKIFRLARQCGLHIAGFTNGFAIPDFQELLSEYAQDVAIISVTLDGLRDKHNASRELKSSYDRAVRSIDTLIEIGVPVKVKMNVNKANILDVPEVVRFYRQKGWWDAPGVYFEVSPIQYGGISLARDTSTDIELGLDFMHMVEQNQDLAKIDFLPLVDNKYHLIDALGVHHFSADVIPDNARVPRIHNCPSYSQHMFVFGADGRLYLCNEQVGMDRACFGRFEGEHRLDEGRMELHYRRDVTAMTACSTCAYGLFCGGGCGHHSNDEAHFCATIREDFKMIIDRYKQRILAAACGE